MSKTNEILKSYGLRVTPVRKEILNVLQSRTEAVPQPQLEKLLSDFDRVTLYRTLGAFEESGLVHKVLNDQGVGNYALCGDACGPDHHHHAHVHLECDSCGKVYCLDEVDVPEIKFPARHKAHGMKILVHGLCDQCAD